MGDDKDDVRFRYPPISLGSDSLHGQKLDVRSAPYVQPVGNRYVDDEEDGEEEDYEEEDPGSDGQRMVKDVGSDGDDDESDGEGPDNGVQNMDSDDDDDDDDSDGEDGVDRNEKQNGYDLSVDVDVVRYPKKRKMKSLISSYEFVPRVRALVPPRPAPTPAPPALKSSSGGRNSLTDWTERETLVLLDAWGDRFLRRGRKSLRFEEWQEVTEKVSEVSRIERSDTQCRNRLDTLKKKYKKEKTNESSKWVYFKKMDMLMSPSSPPQRPGLSCGLDSGGYVFVNPRVYLNRANGLNEMRDSPDDDSESTEGDNDSDGLPPKKRRSRRDNDDECSSVRMLADCIHKFSDIYEKTESSKRKQMAELEKMRMDFHRDLEMQKRAIIERAKAEIARIQEESENA